MFNMYMHGGSGNHGCEAIIRSSTKILNDFPIKKIYLGCEMQNILRV